MAALIGGAPVDRESIEVSAENVERLITIGKSRFGRVKLAKHTITSAYFALKIISKQLILELAETVHCMGEKKTLKSLDHPSIVKLFSTMQDNKSLFFLLEFVPGGTLQNRLIHTGRFPNDITRFYAADIMLALEYLQKQGLAYRALDPSNVMIDSSGYTKLVDFANTKNMFDEKKKPIRTFSHVGIAAFQPPEIIKASKYGHGLPVDWWALGNLVFEMLAGYPPFYDVNPLGSFEKIMKGVIDIPVYVQQNAKEFIEALLNPDPVTRLGKITEEGCEIRKSRWMKPVNFEAMAARTVTPPWLPQMMFPGDTSHFETYPPSSEDPAISENFTRAKEEFKLF